MSSSLRITLCLVAALFYGLPTCSSVCQDSQPECPDWESTCQTDPITRGFCPKTCGLCDEGYKPNSTLSTNKSSNVFVRGEAVTMTCQSVANPAQCDIMFYQGDKLLATQSNSTCSASHVISSIQGVGSDSLSCVAKNDVGNGTRALLNVTIQDKHIITMPQSPVTLFGNQQLNLTCKADSNPPPINITWTRNQDPDILSHQETLTLTAVESYPGNYTCSIANGIGSLVAATYNVIVKACEKHTCQNGGECEQSKGTTYRCLCVRGFRGQFCGLKDGSNTEFNIAFIIVGPYSWTNEYGMKSSEDYKVMEGIICKKMKEIFNIYLWRCHLTNLRKGSIIAETRLIFVQNMRESEVVAVLKNVTSNNTFGVLQLKPSSLGVIINRKPCDTKPCMFDGKCIEKNNDYRCECKLFRYGPNCNEGIGYVPGVLIITAACLIFVVIIILIFLYFCHGKKRATKIDLTAQPEYEMKGNHPLASSNIYLPQDNEAMAYRT